MWLAPLGLANLVLRSQIEAMLTHRFEYAGKPIFASEAGAGVSEHQAVRAGRQQAQQGSLLGRLLSLEAQCTALQAGYAALEEDSLERLDKLEVRLHRVPTQQCFGSPSR
jgi:hypothetical protein